MCGIAGMVGLPYQEHSLKEMMKTMLRRGPDSNGVVRKDGAVLLHSRLASVDPEGGKQPRGVLDHCVQWGAI